MKIKAANGFARVLKTEGIPWVSCYPTNHVNNALGEEGVPILMMGEERFAVAVADGVSRVTNGKQIGVCTVMANLNAAGIQMAYGAIAQAWEDSSPLLVIAEGVGVGASRHTHYDMAEAFKSVTKWVGKVDRADLVPDYARRAFTHLRSGRPGPVLLIIPRDLGEYDEAEHPYATVKGWRSGPDPDDVRSAVKALLAAKDPLLYVGEGVLYADATAELPQFRRGRPGAGAHHPESQGCLPREPSVVGGRARVARRAFPPQGRPPLLRRIEPLPQPVQPRHSRRGEEGHRPVHGGHPGHQPELRDSPRRDRRREAHAPGAPGRLSAPDGRGAQEAWADRGDPQGKVEFLAKFRLSVVERHARLLNPIACSATSKVLDPQSLLTPPTPAMRDQTSTVYEAQIPRGYLGWGNVSTLGFSLAGAVAAKLAYPNRQCVNVTGDAGVCCDGQLRGGGATRSASPPSTSITAVTRAMAPASGGPGTILIPGRCPTTMPPACPPWRGRLAFTVRT